MATITTRTLPLRDFDANGSEHRLLKPDWHRTVPKAVARAESWSTGSAGWTAWATHLAERKDPQPVAMLCAGKRPALAWGLTFGEAENGQLPTTAALLAILDRVERGKSWTAAVGPFDLVSRWLQSASQGSAGSFGIECLAWARALPGLAALLPADLWWQLLDVVVGAAQDAERQPGPSVAPPARQWLTAELPLTLAYLFPELNQTRALATSGSRSILADHAPAVSAEGMPALEGLGQLQALLATAARSRLLARSMKKSGWDDAAEARYITFLRHVLRLCRADGTIALTPPAKKPDPQLFLTALEGTSRVDRLIGREAIAGLVGPRTAGGGEIPPPAAHNEAARLSILRPSWSSNRERLTVARDGGQLRTELAAGHKLLWSGAWTCEVSRNGVPLVPDADAEWDEVCWTTNEDVDYLEVELALSGDVRVQRQMLLARDDQFLFIADAVLGTEAAALEYRSVLPLADGVTFDASTECREGYLVQRKARGMLLPLALPEWRAEHSLGALECSAAGLVLRASHPSARRLYAPLFIDLNPKRFMQPTTWRQLTVAESRQIMPADQAVGYRVQIRKKQWLVYRSLDGKANRTLLGQNLVSDFLIARFDTTGEIAPLLDIE